MYTTGTSNKNNMKNELLIQYGAIRNTIEANLQTIGQLINQAENLKKIVEKMNGTNGETVEDLKNQIEEIEDTIARLIKQTGDLFQKYNQFVEQVFSNNSAK